jgi:beta-fructofuranosidase
MPIGYLAGEKKLMAGSVLAPFELKEGEALELTIFLDKDMVEVFANDRQAIMTSHESGLGKTEIELFSEGAAIQASVKGWKMRSTYGNN